MTEEYRIGEQGLEALCQCFQSDKEHVWKVMASWKKNVTLIVEDSCKDAEMIAMLEKIQQNNAYIYVIRGSKLF